MSVLRWLSGRHTRSAPRGSGSRSEIRRRGWLELDDQVWTIRTDSGRVLPAPELVVPDAGVWFLRSECGARSPEACWVATVSGLAAAHPPVGLVVDTAAELDRGDGAGNGVDGGGANGVDGAGPVSEVDRGTVSEVDGAGRVEEVGAVEEVGTAARSGGCPAVGGRPSRGLLRERWRRCACR